MRARAGRLYFVGAIAPVAMIMRIETCVPVEWDFV